MTEIFSEASYKRHKSHEAAHIASVPTIIDRPDTIDAWRHQRINALLDPLIEQFSDKTWLTVGDMGGEAFFLKSHGAANVTATNITAEKLLYLKRQGLMDGISVEQLNAENINKPDDSFDIVVCKESYHHFPRPPVAFYELMRVARIAVALIEPVERSSFRLLDFVKYLAKVVLRSKSEAALQFEVSGNFLFRLSVPELKKMSTAMQFNCVAIKEINDFYHASTNLRSAHDAVPMTFTRFGIAAQNILCRTRLMTPGLISALVFKAPVDDSTFVRLRKHGYRIYRLPRNPYGPIGSQT